MCPGKARTRDTEVQLTVYSKEGCGICQKAKEKLDMFGLGYKEKDLERLVEPHDGWEKDESVELLAAYLHLGSVLPVIRINEEYHDYPSAMRRLRDLGLTRRTAALEG